MKSIQRFFQLILGCVLICCMLTACQKDSQTTATEDNKTSEVQQEQAENKKTENNETGNDEIGNNPTEEATNQENTNNEPGSVTEEPKATEEANGGNEKTNLIEDQTFEVTLKPFGKVRFESYQPDAEEPLADVTFAIVKDEEVVSTLPGVFEDNIRANEMFNQVEAVSFLDYNQDGWDDIIIICSYSPASGPDVGTGYSEVRIYSGSEDGTFTFEEELSNDANSALAEKTIQSVKGFIGVGRTESSVADDVSFQHAYVEYLQNAEEEDPFEGYALIYLDDDDIPEVVEVGSFEAMGCKILNYSNGEVRETQLNRLYFSYIERGNLLCNSEGNMDNYYDLVYSIIDGEMTLIAYGYYGAEDNSNVQFDEAGEPIYVYEWNGVKMEKEEYEKELNAVYDTKKAVDGYVWEELYSKEEVILAIEKLGE